MMSENLKVVDEVTEETVDTNEEVVEESKLKAICTKVKDTTKKHWKTGVKALGVAGGLCMIYALRHSSSRDCDDDTVYDVDSSPEIIDEEDISEEKSEETNEE